MRLRFGTNSVESEALSRRLQLLGDAKAISKCMRFDKKLSK